MDQSLRDKVAVVTGASRGIGRAIAVRLAQEGMQVVITARSGPALEAVAAECANRCQVLPLDLRADEAAAQLLHYTVGTLGRIDLLVNNAGATRRGDFLELTEADWSDGFALKFYGAVRCCRAAWPHLAAVRGSIVNIIGIGGRTGSADFAIGGAVNAALMNLTKVLADKGLRDGVKVNAINPGSIATERLQTRIQKAALEQHLPLDRAAEFMARQLGVTRFGEPAEIAAAVVFLASSQSTYCQGVLLDVDGGQTRTL